MFLVGDLVLLAAKYIRTLRVSKKLADRNLGLFKILERKSQNTYTLELLVKYGCLYLTFYVSLLKLYRIREGYVIPKPIDIAGDEEWEVERILDKKVVKNVPRWLVRQKGFSKVEDTQEPTRNLKNVKDILRAYKEGA